MIIFKKKLKNFVWVPDMREEEGTLEEVLYKYDDIVYHLSEPLKIEDGVTFGEFFTPIMEKWEDFEILFASQLGHYSLKSFYEEWNSPVIKKEKDEDYPKDTIIEVAWSGIEIDMFDISMTQYNYPMFHGVRKTTEKERSEGPIHSDTIYLGLEFSPINEFREMLFRVNTEVKVTQWDRKAEEKFKELGKFEQNMTIYDVIGTIFYEISFLGSPDSRDESRREILDSADRIKAEFDNGEGLKDAHEIAFDEQGRVTIDGVVQTEDDESDKKGNTISLDDMLKKFNIDKPKQDNEDEKSK